MAIIFQNYLFKKPLFQINRDRREVCTLSKAEWKNIKSLETWTRCNFFMKPSCLPAQDLPPSLGFYGISSLPGSQGLLSHSQEESPWQWLLLLSLLSLFLFMEPVLNLSVSLGRIRFTNSHKIVREIKKWTLQAAPHAIAFSSVPSTSGDICILKKAIALIQNKHILQGKFKAASMKYFEVLGICWYPFHTLNQSLYK